MKYLFAAILILLPAMAQTRPAPPARTAAAPVHRRVGAAAPAKISDPDLEKAIRARFAKSKINSNHFEVHVQGGTATLSGKTDVIQHKGTATRLARGAGAANVVNHIQVSQAARDHAAANLSQGRRRAQVKRSDGRSETAQARSIFSSKDEPEGEE